MTWRWCKSGEPVEEGFGFDKVKKSFSNFMGGKDIDEFNRITYIPEHGGVFEGYPYQFDDSPDYSTYPPKYRMKVMIDSFDEPTTIWYHPESDIIDHNQDGRMKGHIQQGLWTIDLRKNGDLESFFGLQTTTFIPPAITDRIKNALGDEFWERYLESFFLNYRIMYGIIKRRYLRDISNEIDRYSLKAENSKYKEVTNTQSFADVLDREAALRDYHKTKYNYGEEGE